MNVAELIKQLQQLDPEAIVVLSKDGEGNSYSPVDSLDTAMYFAETSYCGEVACPADLEDGSYEGREDGRLSVVLWPMN